MRHDLSSALFPHFQRSARASKSRLGSVFSQSSSLVVLYRGRSLCSRLIGAYPRLFRHGDFTIVNLSSILADISGMEPLNGPASLFGAFGGVKATKSAGALLPLGAAI